MNADPTAKVDSNNNDLDQEAAAKLVYTVKKMALKDEKDKMKKAKLDIAKAIFDKEVARQDSNDNNGKNTISQAEECREPLVRDPVDLRVRLPRHINKGKPVEQIQFSSRDLRLELWHSIMGYGPFKAPIVGPFEVALPPWLDFHGLVWGEDGEIYKEVCSRIPEFLTIGWTVKDSKATSLVVGFKITHEDEAKAHWTWESLATLWIDVMTWVTDAYDGSAATLQESLTVSYWRRLAATRDDLLTRQSQLSSEANLDAAK
ncbi:hypothetical protein FIE12Z_5230 [Fusarium flagelliforme]|uniref:Uncharacterized protein n=1 Tax=Fusarium flagelliforme TaxID=2675880 RepID=A0A395MRZ7_9HYPO|nr:hypothetical protein FIE12Z_5230 [Fusarium flagelliforme]